MCQVLYYVVETQSTLTACPSRNNNILTSPQKKKLSALEANAGWGEHAKQWVSGLPESV